MSGVAIRLHGLTLRHAFAPVDADIPRGALTQVVGAVGTGRSSFLLAVSGRMRGCHGSGTVNGHSLDSRRTRELILLMLQLTSSGGLYPMQTTPKVFQGMHPFMPMTYLIDGLRVTISGGLGSHLARDIMVLATVLVGALTLSTLVVMRQRRWASFRLHPPIEM